MTTREPISPPPTRPKGGVQNLIKANRSAAPEDENIPPAVDQTARIGETKQVTFYMPVEDRQRAKAAYLATSGQEMDASWSEFVTRAVMSEVLRRERVYNEGEKFPGGTRNLAPGRKLAP